MFCLLLGQSGLFGVEWMLGRQESLLAVENRWVRGRAEAAYPSAVVSISRGSIDGYCRRTSSTALACVEVIQTDPRDRRREFP